MSKVLHKGVTLHTEGLNRSTQLMRMQYAPTDSDVDAGTRLSHHEYTLSDGYPRAPKAVAVMEQVVEAESYK